MGHITKLLAVIAVLGIIGGTIHDSYAGSGSGGGSKSSGSSSSSSSKSSGGSYSKPSSGSSSSGSGYNKPSNSGSHNSSNTPSSGYSKPSTVQHNTTDTHAPSKPSAATNSILGSAGNKNLSADSLKAYQAERSTATKPPQPINKSDAVNNPARDTYKNTDTYMSNRGTVVKNYHNTNPNITGHTAGLHPNYGIWDSSFLTGMIMGYLGTSLLHNSMWMYSHMNEPWYKNYRADLETQAANNAELRSKLTAMDAEIAKLKAENATPHKPNVIPTGIDPALAIAPEAMIIADDKHDGMSWWWALGFFSIGLTFAGFAFFAIVKLSK